MLKQKIQELEFTAEKKQKIHELEQAAEKVEKENAKKNSEAKGNTKSLKPTTLDGAKQNIFKPEQKIISASSKDLHESPTLKGNKCTSPERPEVVEHVVKLGGGSIEKEKLENVMENNYLQTEAMEQSMSMLSSKRIKKESLNLLQLSSSARAAAPVF